MSIYEKKNCTLFVVMLRTPSRANYEHFHVYLAYRSQTGTVVTRQTYDRAPRLTRPPTAHISRGDIVMCAIIVSPYNCTRGILSVTRCPCFGYGKIPPLRRSYPTRRSRVGYERWRGGIFPCPKHEQWVTILSHN